MKILITGASGQVAKSLLVLFKETNWTLFSFSRAELDITDKSVVFEKIILLQPDFIINTAAYTAVDSAETNKNSAYAVNSLGVSYLAQAAQVVGAAIIHFSTDYIFSGISTAEYSESDTASPLNVYGESKYAGEQILQKEMDRFIILRTSWVFSECNGSFVSKILQRMKVGNVLHVVEDQQGGPTYAGDLAQVTLQFLRLYERNRTLPWGVYHFAGTPFVSWYEFALEILAGAIELKIIHDPVEIQPVSSGFFGAPAKRPLSSCLNSGKLKNTVGILPSNWREGLRVVLVKLANDEVSRGGP